MTHPHLQHNMHTTQYTQSKEANLLGQELRRVNESSIDFQEGASKRTVDLELGTVLTRDLTER
jgi:hypothetical protein